MWYIIVYLEYLKVFKIRWGITIKVVSESRGTPT